MEKLHSDNNIDHNIQNITDEIFSAAEQSIPNKEVTIKPGDNAWITCHIKKMIRKRKRSYRQFKRTASAYFWNKYKLLRNKVNKEIRKSKQQYFDKLDRQLSCEKCDPKIFWRTSKQLLSLGRTRSNIPTLILNNEHAENDSQKARMLNQYFSSQTTVNDTNKSLPHLDPVQHNLESITISIQDVKDVLQHLNISKACGPDLISPRLLKEGASILASPYCTVFNRSLIQGYFPSCWKDANVTPVYKKDDKSLPNNYRPISLLSLVGKVMERCVHKHLYNYIVEHQLLTPLQSGFVQGDSTTYQLLHTYHTFCEAVDSGKEVRAVFCDISKAFDRVWHKGLLHKLWGIGCSNEILKWFSNYLSGRRQRVVLNGETSDWAPVLAGVPQGSILGPLLFLLYINDIVRFIGCAIRLFADDTSLYIIVDCPTQSASLLNADLKTISDWADAWLVTFNANKTSSMVFTRKQNPLVHPPLFMNNTMINETKSHKHLGLTFSNTCNWAEHITSISEKAWTRLNLLRALKFRISRKSLEKLYVAYIRPVLEYSDSVWDNCSIAAKKRLDAIHIEAARIITGATKLCSIEKLFYELGWESLESRRNKHKLVLFYKIVHGLTPSYLSDLVPPTVQETTPYSLRNSGHIQSYRTNSNLFLDSFFPSTIRAWNRLPSEVQEAPSVQAFKFRLNRDLHTPPRYFNTGTRKGQILQARLRMGCSSLNSDLYRKNIVPSPSCQCGHFESAAHFFFNCPNYNEVRLRYLPGDLHTYTVQDLLFGMENQTVQENESLFVQVQDFIVRSGRFL
ncbi:MAG: reverse transcriptase family protein [Candidatus Thiodiazotropha endolucinida]|nr:reverse transcriptase family protein [Candidatus Thiodiazotropha taylori]MCW4260238.1 reverse transcriptase family protein [Candidatus Thiodiazotropha endolucinida]